MPKAVRRRAITSGHKPELRAPMIEPPTRTASESPGRQAGSWHWTSTSPFEREREEVCPLLAQDPLHSLRPSHDVTSIHVRRCSAITHWLLPRVGTCESAGGAASVTTQAAARPSFCFLGIPARPSRSWCVREPAKQRPCLACRSRSFRLGVCPESPLLRPNLSPRIYWTLERRSLASRTTPFRTALDKFG